ncbi:CdaR family protein [Ectobacillus ponti]|uniref:CdaR family protein n=1 Tax=Ectobacillus ponti TaxID=2961894 RepID=A0AA42BV62_9BACI|nr:CdaR family protein [Ectobacillus ponti]MCP8971278.1 CdaR family protein [Ectobacillus ponti]
MDKLMDNHWFLKGISLLLAFILYMSINTGKQPESFTSSGFPFGNVTETISDVKVIPYYDQEKYVVTGIPEHVNMTLEGQGSLIVSTKLKQQFEVYMNLNEYEPGTHDVKLQYTGIPDGLSVKLSPAKARVTIQERVKKAFPVEVSFVNANQMKEGYQADKVSIKPGAVDIYGTAEQLEQVGAVRVLTDLKGASQTFTKEARVTIYDKTGRRMDLQTKPEFVSVTVPVISPEKSVPIKVDQKGALPNGVHLVSIQTDPEEVTVYGPKDSLRSIESIEGIVVDLDKITEDTTLEADIPLPKGAVKLSSSTVQITVRVKKDENRAFTDVPLTVKGLGTGYSLNFLEPKTGKIAVEAVGDKQTVAQLTAAQIQPFISLQDIGLGTHDVPVQINPVGNVSFKLGQQNVKVEVINKS